MKFARRDVSFNVLVPDSEPIWKLCLEIEKHPDIPNKKKYLAIGVLRSMLYLKHNKNYIGELAYLASTDRTAFFKERNKDPYADGHEISQKLDLVRAQSYLPLQTQAGIITANLAFHIDGYAGTTSIEESVKKIEENVHEVEAVATGLLALSERVEHIKNYAMKVKDSPTGCTAERLSEPQVYGASVITNAGEKPAIAFSKLISEDDFHKKIATKDSNKADAFIAYLKLFADKAGEKLKFANGTELVIKPENYKKIIKEAATELEDIICVDSAIPKNFDDAMWNQVLEKMFSQAKVTYHNDGTGIYPLLFDGVNEAQVYLNYLHASGLDGFSDVKLKGHEKNGWFNLADEQLSILQSLLPANLHIEEPVPVVQQPAPVVPPTSKPSTVPTNPLPPVKKKHQHGPFDLNQFVLVIAMGPIIGLSVLIASGFSFPIAFGSFVVCLLGLSIMHHYIDKHVCNLTQNIAGEKQITVALDQEQKTAFIAGLDAGSSYQGAFVAWKKPQTYTKYFEYAAGKHLAANQNPEMVQELRTKFTVH